LKLNFNPIRKAKAEKGNIKTHTQMKRSGFHDPAKVKRLRQTGAEMVQDSKATTGGGVAGCNIERRSSRVE